MESLLHTTTSITHLLKLVNGNQQNSLTNGFCMGVSSFSLSFKVTKKSPLVIVAAAKKDSDEYKKKEDTHSFAPKPDESFFPEAVLLKQKKVQEDGKLLPEFADEEEKELFEFLNLPLESEVISETRRHYEVVYLIHEKHDDEVEQVNEKIQEFLKEKKGKVWRFNDWGLRRLAYKIKKAKKAHYFLTNFELEAQWINDFKTMLDQDERVIRHLVIKKDEAETEDCPPPPEFRTVCSGMDDDEEDDDIDYDDEDLDDDAEMEGYDDDDVDAELDDNDEALKEEEEEEEEEDGLIMVTGDVDVRRDLNTKSSSGRKSGSSRKTEKVGR